MKKKKFADDLFDISHNFNDKVALHDISDIFKLCENNYKYKFISVLLCMSLRRFNITSRECDFFLKQIGALSSQTYQKLVDIFISDNFEQFSTDSRGGKHTKDFYERFLEIELEAK